MNYGLRKNALKNYLTRTILLKIVENLMFDFYLMFKRNPQIIGRVKIILLVLQEFFLVDIFNHLGNEKETSH